jgi:carboxyl-terminal processing protease
MTDPLEPTQTSIAADAVPAVPVEPVVPALPPAPAPMTSGPAPKGRGYTKWVVAVLAPVLAVVVFASGVAVGDAGLLASSGSADAPTASGDTSASDLALIGEAWKAIEDNYVDAKDLNTRDLAYGAIKGLVDAVGDEGHTRFLTADEVKATDQSLSGTFVGIGVQLDTSETDAAIISSVIPGTPAEAAGLKRGDKITAVDGKTTKGEAIDDIVSRVRGPEGQPVKLTIERGNAAPFDVSIVRKQFALPLVSWAMVPGQDVAMIRLDQFASGATKDIQDAITKAKAAGAKKIVLDLRGNPGGYVSEAVGVASQFVGDGIVFQSVDRGDTEKDVPVQAGGLATDIPLVVLADGNTASSAEIVTGAIQDADRGKVVGEKTFGTGTVLARFNLSDGSALSIGTERWLTRDGRPIWHEGLEPDFKVALPDTVTPVLPDDLKSMTPAELAASKDAQLLKALEVIKSAN